MRTCRWPRRYGYPILLLCAGAWLWRAGLNVPGVPVLTDLGTLGGEEASARALNDRGQVVGWSATRPGTWRSANYGPEANPCHAVLWEHDRARDLGTLHHGGWSRASSINNRGQIVGAAGRVPDYYDAFVWENGSMRPLPSLPGYPGAHASGINESGQIVGSAASRDPYDHVGSRAVLWDHGRVYDLNQLYRPPQGWILTGGGAINDRGEIVGLMTRVARQGRRIYRRPFLLSGGRFYDIGSSLGAGRASCSVRGISNRGELLCMLSSGPSIRQVVWRPGHAARLAVSSADPRGAWQMNGSGLVAGLCFPGRGRTALAIIGARGHLQVGSGRMAGAHLELRYVDAINDRGQAVGIGTDTSGRGRAFLLSGLPLQGLQ